MDRVWFDGSPMRTSTQSQRLVRPTIHGVSTKKTGDKDKSGISGGACCSDCEKGGVKDRGDSKVKV